MNIKMAITRWWNRSLFKYKYVCPNGCSELTNWEYHKAYCPYCGAKFVRTDDIANLCPNCGTPKLYESKYCRHCGREYE